MVGRLTGAVNMPFDYEAYKIKCDGLSTEQLHKEWENYTRRIAGGATSTAASVMFSPLTAGVSLVGLGLSGPRIHNARKKREIIEAGLQARGETHNTRKRDVALPMAISGTISGLTLGLAGPGADMLAGEAVGKGAEYVAAHVALEAAGGAAEHAHTKHGKTKADIKLQKQYQNFQKQYLQEQAKLQGQSMPANMRTHSIQQPPNPYTQYPQPAAQMVETGPPPTMQPYHPQTTLQDHKYDYVPVAVSAAHHRSISYQPASRQEGFVAPDESNQAVAARIASIQHSYSDGPQAYAGHSQLPPYSPSSQQIAISASVPAQKYTYEAQHPTGRTYSDAYPAAEPIYVPTQSPAPTSAQQQVASAYRKEPATVITQAISHTSTETSAMERQIELLQAQVRQMELERASSPKANQAANGQPPSLQQTISQSQETLAPIVVAVDDRPLVHSSTPQHQQSQYQAPLSSAPGPLQPTPNEGKFADDGIADGYQAASNFYYSPPAPSLAPEPLNIQRQELSQPQSAQSPNSSQTVSAPTIAPHLYEQQAQSQAKPLQQLEIHRHDSGYSSPLILSQQPHPPPLQHQDSGYYSQPPSRHASVASSQYCPTPQSTGSLCTMPSPQVSGSVKGVHARGASYARPPLTPQPGSLPYFAPPPGAPAPGSMDYFDTIQKQMAPFPPPQNHRYSPVYAPSPAHPGPPGPPTRPPTQHYQQQPPPIRNFGTGYQPGAGRVLVPRTHIGPQGWQWGAAGSQAAPQEPIYGAVSVPRAYK